MARIFKTLANYKLFCVFLLCFWQNIAWAQIPVYSDEQRIKMRKDAEKLLENYFFNLRQIGSPEPTAKAFREDDILVILTSNLENQNIQLYNDITRVKETEYLEARDYLNKVGYDLYKSGVEFNYITLNVKNPCYESRVGDKYFYIKIEILKRLKGLYALDDGMHTREDSVDVYVKFPILQNRPNLILGLPKIYRTTVHQETECDEVTDIENKTSLKPFDENLLKARAEIFVRDYGLTLNILGNPRIVEIYTVMDYFDNKSVRVYNDLFPQILRDYFPAEDYFTLIDKWFQQGIEFFYTSVNASNLLVEADYVSVQVDVDRLVKVPIKGFRNRDQLSIFVKFPIVEREVGAERITPRIYKITKRETKINSKNYISAGIQIAALNYFGDLNPFNRYFSTELSFTKPAISLHFTKKINKRLFIRGNLTFGRIKGEDVRSADPFDALAKFRYARNLHFRNDIQELAFTALYDLKKNEGLHYRRSRVTPYVFAGIGVIHHNPKARTPQDFGGAWIPLRPLRTEGQGLGLNPQGGSYPKMYSLFQPVIPFGVGLKIKFNSRIDIGWEVGMRYTFTDYLDDVSGVYPDPAVLPSDLARRMYNRVLEGTSYIPGTGTLRQDNIDRLNFEITGTNTFITTYTDGDNVIRSINGYGRFGDQRGGGTVNDIYLITGFRLTYLIRVGKVATSNPSKSKVRYDFGN